MRLLFLGVGLVTSLQTELSDAHFEALRSNWARAPESERLALLNRTTASVRAMRARLAIKLQNMTSQISHQMSLVKELDPWKAAAAKLEDRENAPRPHLMECGLSCGWSMYRDMTALARFIVGDQCELRDWVDWWSSGLATMMVDQGEPLHRALLRSTQLFTGVGYGAPYVADPNALAVRFWDSLHGMVASLSLLSQTDRIVAGTLNNLHKGFKDISKGKSAMQPPTSAEFAGYALMIECLVTAMLLSSDVAMDGSRRSSEPGPVINGFYLAAMTASSVGYGDFAPYSAVAAYLSPVWMTILTGPIIGGLGGPKISLIFLQRTVTPC